MIIANKIHCDRCGNECIEGSTYYTIDIYGHDINPTNDGRIAFDAYSQNFSTNLNKLLKQQKHYCKKCKQEIEKFIDPKLNTVESDKLESEVAKYFEDLFKKKGF
jgi:hypothetical protein